MMIWIPLLITVAYTGFAVFLTWRGGEAAKTARLIEAVSGWQESMHTAFLARQRQLNKGG